MSPASGAIPTATTHFRSPTRALLAELRAHRRSVLVGTVASALSVALQVAIPWSLKLGFDALGSANARALTRAALLLGGSVIGQAAVRIFARVTLFDVGRNVEYELRRRILDQLHKQGGSFFRRMGTGEIMSRAVNDLGNVRLLFGFATLNLVNTALVLAFALSMMFAISAELTLVALVFVPVFVITIRRFGRSMFSRSRAAQEHLGVMTARVQESLTGIRVIRAYGIQDRELADFERLNAGYVAKNLALAALRGFLFPLMGMVGGLGLLVTIWYGGRMVATGEITLGDLVAMQGYIAMLTWPTAALGYVLSIYQRGIASWERIDEILTAVPEVPPPGAPSAGAPSERSSPGVEQLRRQAPSSSGVDSDPRGGPRPVSGDLEVRSLSHSHEGGGRALADVSFTVPRGGRVAIVGRTGSGKTTLANLLPRLLPTPKGAISIGGRDVTELGVEVLRRTVGYSPQDPFLFSTTIAKNIAFGLADPDAPDAMRRIAEAARAAQIEEEIRSLPDGYDTVVGERGVQLSGGQKQRIALARALAMEPEILVLDDPLSAVDAATERRILDAIDVLVRDRRTTLVLVTHRCSAAARMDDVVVLDAGRVVEHGPAAELEKLGGIYAGFFERQLLEEEMDSLADSAVAGPS